MRSSILASAGVLEFHATETHSGYDLTDLVLNKTWISHQRAQKQKVTVRIRLGIIADCRENSLHVHRNAASNQVLRQGPHDDDDDDDDDDDNNNNNNNNIPLSLLF